MEKFSNAFQLLEETKDGPLSSKERQQKAIQLAEILILEATRIQTKQEKKQQEELSRLMHDPQGKAFTTAFTDQCFRSHTSSRSANQLVYLLKAFGIPRYLGYLKQMGLSLFEKGGKLFAPLLVPLVIWQLRKETSKVILPAEKHALLEHLQKRIKEGVRLNLNHLGEAILGEEESKRRLEVYLSDLAQDAIEYVSIKISTIFSQLNLLDREKTLEILADRLRSLYRVAMHHSFLRADGVRTQKFVNLDMEEYRDVNLTLDLFKKVLSEKEFHTFSAGIVLQAYLPDSFLMQKELTTWALERVKNGGAPLKIRIVKGANLAMEGVEASLYGWPQAPYKQKVEVDANYKRMLEYGMIPLHAKAVHLGVASHNLFDIAYALLLRAENSVEKEVSFEMLEGMADPLRRALQRLSKEILLYCPVAKKEDFQSSVAYLIRRLDENTGPENFLRHIFDLRPGTQAWEEQSHLFLQSCSHLLPPSAPRRTQNRLHEVPPLKELTSPFENEPDTDFSLPANIQWIQEIYQKEEATSIPSIPPRAGLSFEGKGIDPAYPLKISYTYALSDIHAVDQALTCAKKTEKVWASTPPEERAKIVAKAAHLLRKKRGEFIGCMLRDTGKTAFESDPEISEAIDFAEYYLRSYLQLKQEKDLTWTPKGTLLIASPWNFPLSIPAGGIFAALLAGNCVLFKPAPEAVYTGWKLTELLWEAGVPPSVLHYVNCVDDPVGSALIQDNRLNGVILTGATSTAHLFLKLRPSLPLWAETGGKNSLIITALADHDLALKDLIQSAFGHSGQKCSAASLAILEKEVYDNPAFLRQLKDAVESLSVAPAWNRSAKVVPLIRPAGPALLRALTTLDPGESWLVQPKQDPHNPHLWSPGVKLGVKEGSFMHHTELFGPVLAVMRAHSLPHALELANSTPYGLTAGLHSLDEREHKLWVEKIEAGNLYINRSITGAIVQRQPFGGCKASSFGSGMKAGGPHYVSQFATPKQVSLPTEQAPLPPVLERLSTYVETLDLSPSDKGVWHSSIAHYALWASRFRLAEDPSKLLGQDNFLFHRPLHGIVLRLLPTDSLLDFLRSCAAALACETPLQISYKIEKQTVVTSALKKLLLVFKIVEEEEEHFLERVRLGAFKRVRVLETPAAELYAAAAHSATHIASAPVLANGRLELLHYLKEVALSHNYHRYGNLGKREGEPRSPVL